MRERVLITGGSGLLGSTLGRLVAADHDVYATFHVHPASIQGVSWVSLDIRDPAQVNAVVKDIKPALVIHTAALALVDYCEEHPDEARSLNAAATEHVARAAAAAGSRLVYISTDSVFDGKAGNYAENDPTNPPNVYARTKLEGEQYVRNILPESLIIRTAFYGWNVQNKQSLAEWVLAGLRQGRNLSMFTDVYFTPIVTDNLAEAILALYQRGCQGTYHVGGSERCSKYQFGRAVARVFSLDADLVRPSSIEAADFKAPRAADLSLNSALAAADASIPLLDVTGGLELFKKRQPRGATVYG